MTRKVEIDENLKDLMPQYLKNRRQDVGRLERALKTGDLDGIKLIGHKIAGNGPTYGLPELGAIGRRLEENPEDAASAIEDLSRYLSTLEISFVKRAN